MKKLIFKCFRKPFSISFLCYKNKNQKLGNPVYPCFLKNWTRADFCLCHLRCKV